MQSTQGDILLVSASPRRRALLEAAGLRVTVRVSGADETWPRDARDAEAGAIVVAQRKLACAAGHAWRRPRGKFDPPTPGPKPVPPEGGSGPVAPPTPAYRNVRDSASGRLAEAIDATIAGVPKQLARVAERQKVVAKAEKTLSQALEQKERLEERLQDARSGDMGSWLWWLVPLCFAPLSRRQQRRNVREARKAFNAAKKRFAVATKAVAEAETQLREAKTSAAAIIDLATEFAIFRDLASTPAHQRDKDTCRGFSLAG